ncbi:uncharacterized protein [Ambystoma mexicanum]|uniref:uncharacterized protein n=1 Tax=Ambystoma mexicanum TaxID=8296 RepID=UPI0037E9C808
MDRQQDRLRGAVVSSPGSATVANGASMASNGQPATDRISRMRELVYERCRYWYECGLSVCITLFFMIMFGLVTYWFIAFISIEMYEGGGSNNTTGPINSTTGPNVTANGTAGVNTREGDFLIWDGTKLIWGYHTTPSSVVTAQREKPHGKMESNTVSSPGVSDYDAHSLNDRNPSVISWLYNTPTNKLAPIPKNNLPDSVRKENEKLLEMHEILYDEWAKGGGNEEGGSSLPTAQGVGKYMSNKNARRKRETGRKKYDEYYGLGLDKMEDPRHPHQTNKWYADMSATAKQTTNESCYVCSLIPHASGTPKVLLPKELPIVDAQCLLHLTLCRIKNTFQAHEVTFQMLQNEKTCYPKTAGVVCLKEPFFVIGGTLFSDNKQKDEEVLCKAEALRGVAPDRLQWIEKTCTPVWREHISKLTWVTAIEKPFKLQSEMDYKLCFKGEGRTPMGTNSNCNKTLTIPDLKKGTAALMDTYWVCGKQAYLHLPQSWSGSCSMATLHSALMVIPESHIDGSKRTQERMQSVAQPTAESQIYVLSSGSKEEVLTRNRRASNYISKASSELLAQIPDKYRLFSSAETFFASLVSSVQARANAKWLQITRWELIQLANDTEEGFNIIKVELRALRLMTMQNRYVLDLLTAMDGGVCRKIGSACCTFVPSEDTENGSLSHVIEAVHNLGEKMKMEGGAEASTWFDNIFSWVPSWLGTTVKFLIPAVVFLLLLFCLCQMGLRVCANAVPNGAMMMVTMGNSHGTIKTTQEAQVQTGIDNSPRYQLVPIYHDKDIVDKLWHTTIKEPRILEWYEKVWVDLEADGGCIYLTCTPDEYARRGESLRAVCRAWMPIKGTPAWDEAVMDEAECRRIEDLKNSLL